MATGIYLVDNPPVRSQYRSPRREQPSGVIVVHTAESFPDETGPDTGAENVANFIRTRTNAGSYHDLADSDSTIRLVRYSDEAFGDATGSNPHAYHVSAATQAAKWDQLGDQWVRATVRNMAAAVAAYATWLRQQRGIVIPARRVTRAQSEDRLPGFISHAERDPARRTDPGAGFPWGTFFSDYEQIMEDDMPLDATDLAKIDSLLTRKRGEYPSGNPIAISSPAAHLYSWEARNQARENGAMLATLLAAHGGEELTAAQVRAELEAALAANRAADAQAIADLLTPVIEALDDTMDQATIAAALREVLTEGVGA